VLDPKGVAINVTNALGRSIANGSGRQELGGARAHAPNSLNLDNAAPQAVSCGVDGPIGLGFSEQRAVTAAAPDGPEPSEDNWAAPNGDTTNGAHQKVTPWHLSRSGYHYVRQSR
jgi:hypothetical protein